MAIQSSKIAPPSTEETRAALENLLEAFRDGDRDRLANCYDDAVDWLFHAPNSVFPFAGARHDKMDVLKGFGALYENFRITEYHADSILVDGDRASTLSSGNLLQVATGRIIRIRTGNFYRFRNNKVTEYRGFTDSLDIVEQVLGRELEF
jgi:ketosteroid isomerase-like protein